MGVFNRINDIIQSNLVSILDKAEDPEKLLRLMIQEMEEALVEVRSVSAGYLAEQKGLRRRQGELEKLAGEWHHKAELAVSKERDDLAKAALEQKNALLQQASALNEELNRVDQAVEKLSLDIGRLQGKLNEAKAKQSALMQRHKVAATRLKVNTQCHSEKIDQAMARFEMIERKVERVEAQVESYELGHEHSLGQQIEQLARDEELDKELAELKAKFKKTA